MTIQHILFSFTLLSLFACGNGKHIENETPNPPNVPVNPDIKPVESIIWINSYLDNCKSNMENKAHLLSQTGEQIEEGNWECTHQSIIGFNFEPGYIYRLKTTTAMVEGMPQLKLVEQLSKERDPNYFKVYDIWALTHLYGTVLEISDKRPSMEINLTNMTVMGNGSCNNYSGEIKRFTTSKIAFGLLAATKMMCPQIKQEGEFMRAMASVRSYATKTSTLILYNLDMKPVLQFQKVD